MRFISLCSFFYCCLLHAYYVIFGDIIVQDGDQLAVDTLCFASDYRPTMYSVEERVFHTCTLIFSELNFSVIPQIFSLSENFIMIAQKAIPPA